MGIGCAGAERRGRATAVKGQVVRHERSQPAQRGGRNIRSALSRGRCLDRSRSSKRRELEQAARIGLRPAGCRRPATHGGFQGSG